MLKLFCSVSFFVPNLHEVQYHPFQEWALIIRLLFTILNIPIDSYSLKNLSNIFCISHPTMEFSTMFNLVFRILPT
jgi:hypothetical protein